MSYRVVVRHVRYWRGVIQRWSTVYQYGGSLTSALTASDAAAFLALDAGMCYGPAPSDGGAYQCEIYNHATGGVPVVTYNAFAYDAPGTWVAYGTANWPGSGLVFEGSAETALQVEWPSGFSSTGKPVFQRKWYHSVASSTSTGATPDIGAAIITDLTTQANKFQGALSARGLTMQTSTGRFAGTAVVKPFYGNHQMPRGRRRKPLVTASGRYTGPTVVIPEAD
jgi:hypothetical protein